MWIALKGPALQVQVQQEPHRRRSMSILTCHSISADQGMGLHLVQVNGDRGCKFLAIKTPRLAYACVCGVGQLLWLQAAMWPPSATGRPTHRRGDGGGWGGMAVEIRIHKNPSGHTNASMHGFTHCPHIHTYICIPHMHPNSIYFSPLCFPPLVQLCVCRFPLHCRGHVYSFFKHCSLLNSHHSPVEGSTWPVWVPH